MRMALDKLKAFYGTTLGQDVLETLAGSGMAAGGQALFTDMTPEEILLSTGVGMGAAAVGRPVFGSLGQAIGTRISRTNPASNEFSQELIDRFVDFGGPAAKAKMAAYANLNPPAQFGQVIGRGYGDNIAQGVVALAAPGLFAGEEQ